MTRATPQLRSIARRLMAHEASKNESSRTGDPPFPVLEALRPMLAPLMGKAGYRGLLARSLAAASEEVRWLRAVHVKSDGSLMELHELQAQLSPALFLEGRIAMLAQLLGSLVAFIGEELTLQLVRKTWPNLSLKELDLGRSPK
jgi:hypothetical protein